MTQSNDAVAVLREALKEARKAMHESYYFSSPISIDDLDAADIALNVTHKFATERAATVAKDSGEPVRLLREMLSLAVNQGEHDMLLTGDELRAMRNVLERTAGLARTAPTTEASAEPAAPDAGGQAIAYLTLGGIDGEEYDDNDIEIASSKRLEELQRALVRTSESVTLELIVRPTAHSQASAATQPAGEVALPKPAVRKGRSADVLREDIFTAAQMREYAQTCIAADRAASDESLFAWIDPASIKREALTDYADSITVQSTSVKFGLCTVPVYLAAPISEDTGNGECGGMLTECPTCKNEIGKCVLLTPAAPVIDLHAAIMALRPTVEHGLFSKWTRAEQDMYGLGHRDARHAAAELVASHAPSVPSIVPDWAYCNPGCDYEDPHGGQHDGRSAHCACEAAKASIARQLAAAPKESDNG